MLPFRGIYVDMSFLQPFFLNEAATYTSLLQTVLCTPKLT